MEDEKSILPKRKLIRIEGYDYSTPGAYFITVCTANREKIFWSDRRGELRSPACAPTISRVIKQFKGSITKQIGRPIWQKSFYDHAIRNQQDYDEIWKYIENNPLKYALKKAP